MLYLSFFALISTVFVLVLSLQEINPFRPQPLPMLDQIDDFLAQQEDSLHHGSDLRLAA